MERRRFPRQDVQGAALRATLVLTGGSLLKKNSPAEIEIDALPMNLSRTGICLSLGFDATWATISPDRDVILWLEKGGERRSLTGRVVHRREGENRSPVLGLEFLTPLEDLSQFLVPPELQEGLQ